jgi:glycosyltransferase involved in cell wall biosynthesis
MKILHVETGRHFYGGAQQVVYLIEGLQAAAVDNVLVCLPDTEIDAILRPRGVQIFNLACAGDFDLTFAWWLRKILLWERPDVVHCHSRRGADFLGGLAARLAGVPAVVSRRVDHPESEMLAEMRYRGFRRVIAISDNVAAVLRESGLGEDRLAIIRSAVDFRRFQVPPDRAQLGEEFGLADDEFVITAAGQLIPRKGHRYLLEAMAGVKRRMRGVRLVVFGQGSLEADLKAQAAALDLGDSVLFAGFRDDLDRYLGAFDLLVHPALREGLGVVMLKAAAAGVPVVAFDVAGSREAVVDGETGVLVTPKDAAALQEAILQMAANAVLHKRYAEAGRERMRREFSIEAMVDKHIRLYETVVHGAE